MTETGIRHDPSKDKTPAACAKNSIDKVYWSFRALTVESRTATIPTPIGIKLHKKRHRPEQAFA